MGNVSILPYNTVECRATIVRQSTSRDSVPRWAALHVSILFRCRKCNVTLKFVLSFRSFITQRRLRYFSIPVLRGYSTNIVIRRMLYCLIKLVQVPNKIDLSLFINHNYNYISTECKDHSNFPISSWYFMLSWLFEYIFSILITSFLSFIYARGFARFCFLSIIFLYRQSSTASMELKPLCPWIFYLLLIRCNT